MVNAGEGTPHILIVDDELEIRNILCGMLCEGYASASSNSAGAALSILGTEQFDLAISDIIMGGMSGLELIPHELASAPDTVIVMISGEQTITSAIKALRLGAFDYITKPFYYEHVEAGVRRALVHHSLLVTKRRYENNLEELVTRRTPERDHLAYHDALTDLPNRILFEDRLTQALSVANRDGRTLGIVFLSLDQFKKVNDTLGHVVGQRLLQDVADRLNNSIPECETVARFESDEFALLLTQMSDTGDVVAIILRLTKP